MEKKHQHGDYHPFYQDYIDKTGNLSVAEQLSRQRDRISEAWKKGMDLDYRYQPDKWSLREVWIHMIDAETIFAYRALAVSRGETQSLPSYDQDLYMKNDFSHVHAALIQDLYFQTRKLTLLSWASMSAAMKERRGMVMNHPVTVMALFDIIAGHESHHIQILKQRYGIEL